ncbi:MAG: hypothetical protein HWN67_19945 [Candidatus Helarchaeota archaeon]|nr:hypothetical protein [Candidatus Helarchaeota archaeon]
MKINASKPKYETREIFISINIRNIYTNLTYIQPSPVGIDRNVTIQLEYGDIDNGTLISSANIVVSSQVGAQYWSVSNFSYQEISPSGTYNLTFNTSIFGSGGTYVIYVTAYKLNYANATTPISIFVGDRSTTLTSPQIGGVFVPWGRNFTIDVYYNESLILGISGATVKCDWDLNYYTILEIGGGHYQIILNTTAKMIETYTLKINSSKLKYEAKEIFISVIIRNIYTNLTYIQPDSVNFRSNVTIQLEYGDTDNITLISGATITVSDDFGALYWPLSNYSFIEISPLGTYNLTLNTSYFGGVGTFLVYVTASKSNYANATTPISIFVEDMDATLGLFPPDGNVQTYLGQNITLILNYSDTRNGNPIPNANITYSESIIGAGNFNYDVTSELYNATLNTSGLGVGLYYIIIKANGSDKGYEILGDIFTLQILRVPTNLTAANYTYNIIPSSNFTINVIYNVSLWAEYIENATVTYSWPRGEGDLNEIGNGSYEITLTAPASEGLYKITIRAFKDDYQYQEIEIDVNAQFPPLPPPTKEKIPPPIFPQEDIRPLLAMIIIPMIAAIAALSVYMAWYRHFRYPVIVRRMRKAIKNIKKKKSIKPFDVGSRTDIISGLIEKDFEKFQNEILVPLTGKKKDLGIKVVKKSGKKK